MNQSFPIPFFYYSFNNQVIFLLDLFEFHLTTGLFRLHMYRVIVLLLFADYGEFAFPSAYLPQSFQQPMILQIQNSLLLDLVAASKIRHIRTRRSCLFQLFFTSFPTQRRRYKLHSFHVCIIIFTLLPLLHFITHLMNFHNQCQNYFPVINLQSINPHLFAVNEEQKDVEQNRRSSKFIIDRVLLNDNKVNLNIFQIMSSQFNAQLQKLLQREKIARVNNEHFNSVNVLKDIITLCYKAQNWDKLYEMINFLMNRRGQGKKAQIQMIQLAMTWLNDTPQPHRTKLIETIRDVTAKKIFLQVEYARCILMIVKGKQNDNDILQAAKILQEVQVQTYGSMDRRQKLEFILYQMKIMLKKEDYVRLYIISKKINENNLNDDQIADIKIQYYAYLAMYHNHMHNYLEASRCYRIIWKTLKSTKKMLPEKMDFGFSIDINNVLSNYVGYLVLHPWSPVTQAQLRQLQQSEQLQKHPTILNLITNFLSQQIIPTDPQAYSLPQFQLFTPQYKNSSTHQSQLKRVLTQHNIRAISKYYTQLTLQRMSELINVQKEYCEQELCRLNNNKVIDCRVDRINDVVDFKPVQHENQVLRGWNNAVNQILDLVDVASNLINREREIYGK